MQPPQQIGHGASVAQSSSPRGDDAGMSGVGILAYGSLISDPGSENRPADRALYPAAAAPPRGRASQFRAAAVTHGEA